MICGKTSIFQECLSSQWENIYWQVNSFQQTTYPKEVHEVSLDTSLLTGRYCNSTELKYTSQSKKLILLDKLLCFAQRIFKEKGKTFSWDLNYMNNSFLFPFFFFLFFLYFSIQHKTLKRNKVICWTLVLLSRSCNSFEIKNLHKSYFQFFFAPKNHFIHKIYSQALTGRLKRPYTSPWQHLMQCCGLAKLYACIWHLFSQTNQWRPWIMMSKDSLVFLALNENKKKNLWFIWKRFINECWKKLSGARLFSFDQPTGPVRSYDNHYNKH